MTEQQTGKAPTSQKEPAKSDLKKPVGRTYRVIRPGIDKIERCSFILANACQCWKAGEEICNDVRKDGTELVYQYCERHVRIQKAIDAGQLKSDGFTVHNVEPVPYGPIPEETEPPASTQEVAPPPKVEEKKEPQTQVSPAGAKEPEIANKQKEEPHKEHFWQHGEEKK